MISNNIDLSSASIYLNCPPCGHVSMCFHLSLNRLRFALGALCVLFALYSRSAPYTVVGMPEQCSLTA
jgi:hypothetical protein